MDWTVIFMKIFYDINTDHHDDFDQEPIVIYRDGVKTFPIQDACKSCNNHPSNGGSGICNCTLGTPQVKC